MITPHERTQCEVLSACGHVASRAGLTLSPYNSSSKNVHRVSRLNLKQSLLSYVLAMEDGAMCLRVDIIEEGGSVKLQTSDQSW